MFTPQDDLTLTDAIERAADIWRRARRVVVLTGAGISTESGIPDFRSPGGLWSNYRPVHYVDFMRKPEVRADFWLRSQETLPLFHNAPPNAAHRALAELQRAGRLHGLITQNVDGLHQRAGSDGVLELHGNYLAVVCTACGTHSDRPTVLRRLLELNPDHDLSNSTGLRTPSCEHCEGILKPGVVFFGENVPAADAALSLRLAAEADLLIIIGTSLAAYSAYRLAVRAADSGASTLLLNIGPTRFDPRADLIIRAPAGVLLPQIATRVLFGL